MTSRGRFVLIFLCVLACFLVFGLVVPPFIRGYRVGAARNPQDLAVAASVYGHNVGAGGETDGTMNIVETLGVATDNARYRYEVAQDCFSLQRAFWTRYPEMNTLLITIQGPMVGGGTGLFGSCTMKQVNATHQDWTHADAASEWEVYDAESIAPAIAS